MPSDQMARVLAERYLEHPIARGLEASGQLIELYASIDGLTWTLIVSDPNGISCALAAGENWQAVPEPISGI